MKEHFCPAEKSMITYQGKCNWCGEQETLAQTQEPVAYLVLFEGAGKLLEFKKGNYIHGAKVKHIPLYTTPPQRTWVGLNKEEAFELQVKHKDKPSSLSAAVENLLREKNQ